MRQLHAVKSVQVRGAARLGAILAVALPASCSIVPQPERSPTSASVVSDDCPDGTEGLIQGTFTDYGQSDTLSFFLAPCQQVTVTVSASVDHPLYGFALALEAKTQNGSVKFRSAAAVYHDTPWNETFVWPGVRTDAWRLASVTLSVSAAVAPRLDYTVRAVTSPRPGFNQGGQSFDDALRMTLGTKYEGNLFEEEAGQFYLMHLNGGEAVSLWGSLEGTPILGTVFHIYIYNADRTPARLIQFSQLGGARAPYLDTFINPFPGPRDFYVVLWDWPWDTVHFSLQVDPASACGGDFCPNVCEGVHDRALPVINPDSDTESPLPPELFGCYSDRASTPCGGSVVLLDGYHCDPCGKKCSSEGNEIDHHNPDECYGACGAGCAGCCVVRDAYCRPSIFWLNRGINPVTGLPNGCTLVQELPDGRKRVKCGSTAMNYFNVSKDLLDQGRLRDANRRRGRSHSTSSPGACPRLDWDAASPRSFVTSTGTETFTRDPSENPPPQTVTYVWSAIGKQLQACSVNPFCYEHDECHRHDYSIRFLDGLHCEQYGASWAGAAAAIGTPTLGFWYGWWADDGRLRVTGSRYQNPEPKNLLPEQGSDPKLDCFYDFDPTAVTLVLTQPFPADFPLVDHSVEQVECPIHHVRH